MVGQKGAHWKRLQNQASKAVVTCCVPGCDKKYRKDKINRKHYLHVVQCDKNGKPLRPGSVNFNNIEDKTIISHTTYFYEKDLDPKSTKECIIPPIKKLTPFEQMATKRKSSSGDGAGPSKVTKQSGDQSSDDPDDVQEPEVDMIDVQESGGLESQVNWKKIIVLLLV